jgi:hypothetical protein
MPTLSCQLPKPRNRLLSSAHLILLNAHVAADSFFKAFEDVRKVRKAKGTPTDEEQDLVRAGLIFATAGLDAMVKQLIKDALPVVIKRDAGTLEQLAEFVQGRLFRTDSASPQLNSKFLAKVLVADSPREILERDLVSQLTSDSLQSKDQLLRADAFFAIPASDITSSLGELQKIFIVRNQIAHEMDIDLTQSNRKRRPRKRDEMAKYASQILEVATNFYNAVSKKLAPEEGVAKRLGKRLQLANVKSTDGI